MMMVRSRGLYKAPILTIIITILLRGAKANQTCPDHLSRRVWSGPSTRRQQPVAH